MDRAKRILVVGGGSAGWMAAAYLNAALNQGNIRRAQISLIESADAPRIGVGEATIPSILHLLAVIGIDDTDLMKSVDGTFKQSIRYVNWLDNKGEYYHHPFSRYTPQPMDLSSELWLRSDRSIPFMETISPQPVICELGLSPLSLDPQVPGPRLKYAYHMNALKFADYLSEFATARGVTHYIDHVTDVEMAENGDIAAVSTQSGQRIEADLFIDCTGFAALLIEKKLGVPWVDCSQWLLCDQAVTMHVPYEHHYPGRVKPYTTASALSSGWVWDIPLRSTRSLGYVHSSSFLDAEKAERELREFEGSHAAALDVRIVPFKVGRREKVWSRNCIAIGLAGGFIEPLESTGLYLADLATVMLAEHFPRDNDYEPLALRVNRILTNRFYEILDFINMHYCLTRRTDTEFWREVRQPPHITERLQAKLDFWRIKPPSRADFEDQFFPGMPGSPTQSTASGGDGRAPIDTAGLWDYASYEAILYGMDFLAEECQGWFGDNRQQPPIHGHVLETLQRASKLLPKHEAFLRMSLGMPDYPSQTG
ncbi:MAG: tryptophan 7-halogenase [Proteobacteria bacterium]|nr:tryptophan 7-halogenase [Pseudomonadota bacterium]